MAMFRLRAEEIIVYIHLLGCDTTAWNLFDAEYRLVENEKRILFFRCFDETKL